MTPRRVALTLAALILLDPWPVLATGGIALLIAAATVRLGGRL